MYRARASYVFYSGTAYDHILCKVHNLGLENILDFRVSQIQTGAIWSTKFVKNDLSLPSRYASGGFLQCVAYE